MSPSRISRTRTNLYVDLAIFVGFLFAMEPRATGISIHEWLSLAFAAAVILHLLLHWEWIVSVTQRLFARLPGITRINYWLNLLLFIDVTIIIFTGIMISESALPLFGIHSESNFVWRTLHSLASDLAILLLGLHVALHWRWIVDAIRKYIRIPGRTQVANPAKRQPELVLPFTTKEPQL